MSDKFSDTAEDKDEDDNSSSGDIDIRYGYWVV
jgi:hypothetical protein